MGKRSKVKGSGYELKTAKQLSEWWGHDFHRTPASGGLRWNDDNNVAGDIVAPIEAQFPFIVECKKREEWNIENVFLNNKEIKYWWQQVTEDCERIGRTPLLMFSRNRARDFVMLPYIEEVVDIFEKNIEEPTMVTHVSFQDIREDTHRFKVVVTTLENLVTLPVAYTKRVYSEKNFDWRSIRTIEKTGTGPRDIGGILDEL